MVSPLIIVALIVLTTVRNCYGSYLCVDINAIRPIPCKRVYCVIRDINSSSANKMDNLVKKITTAFILCMIFTARRIAYATLILSRILVISRSMLKLLNGSNCF